MFKVPEPHRVSHAGNYCINSQMGNNGLFKIVHYAVDGYYFWVIASDIGGWEHLSISVRNSRKRVDRCATQKEMCYIKNLFWGAGDIVVQYHALAQEYCSVKDFCLHLWRPVVLCLPVPPFDID